MTKVRKSSPQLSFLPYGVGTFHFFSWGVARLVSVWEVSGIGVSFFASFFVSPAKALVSGLLNLDAKMAVASRFFEESLEIKRQIPFPFVLSSFLFSTALPFTLSKKKSFASSLPPFLMVLRLGQAHHASSCPNDSFHASLSQSKLSISTLCELMDVGMAFMHGQCQNNQPFLLHVSLQTWIWLSCMTNVKTTKLPSSLVRWMGRKVFFLLKWLCFRSF